MIPALNLWVIARQIMIALLMAVMERYVDL